MGQDRGTGRGGNRARRGAKEMTGEDMGWEQNRGGDMQGRRSNEKGRE